MGSSWRLGNLFFTLIFFCCVSSVLSTTTTISPQYLWANAAGYRAAAFELNNGFVTFEGVLDSTAATSPIMFQIPTTYIAATGQAMFFQVAAGTGTGIVKIDASGYVSLISGSGKISLEGISYPVVTATTSFTTFPMSSLSFNADTDAGGTLAAGGNVFQSLCYSPYSEATYYMGVHRANVFDNGVNAYVAGNDIAQGALLTGTLPSACQPTYDAIFGLPIYGIYTSTSYIQVVKYRTASSDYLVLGPALLSIDGASLGVVNWANRAYTPASLAANWADGSTAVRFGFYKDSRNVVHARGCGKYSASWPAAGNEIPVASGFPATERDHVLVAHTSCSTATADETYPTYGMVATFKSNGDLVFYYPETPLCTLDATMDICIDGLTYIAGSDAVWTPFPAYNALTVRTRKYQCTLWNCHDPEYYKDSTGVVHMRGVIYWPEGQELNVYNVPASGLVPSNLTYALAATSAGVIVLSVNSLVPGVLSVTPVGANDPTGITWLSLDGVHYIANPSGGTTSTLSSTWSPIYGLAASETFADSTNAETYGLASARGIKNTNTQVLTLASLSTTGTEIQTCRRR
eukprot:TRINITY_DN4457_c0_g1_i13.p1 TRINITY_DN4457_c0_g1~~TRINITY_DN4457_c0_g1_i13.p1  ORF type:complete len:576 (-),score=114.36 TRINITY_DN4457_c0_g1_i13:79-1806(-)